MKNDGSASRFPLKKYFNVVHSFRAPAGVLHASPVVSLTGTVSFYGNWRPLFKTRLSSDAG